MVSKVEAYKTSDEKLFCSFESALAHENNIAFVKWCRDNFCGDSSIGETILQSWKVSKK